MKKLILPIGILVIVLSMSMISVFAADNNNSAEDQRGEYYPRDGRYPMEGCPMWDGNEYQSEEPTS